MYETVWGILAAVKEIAELCSLHRLCKVKLHSQVLAPDYSYIISSCRREQPDWFLIRYLAIMEIFPALVSDAHIQSIFKAVFLPPKLPPNGDSEHDTSEHTLLIWVQDTLDRFGERVRVDLRGVIAKASEAISALGTIRGGSGFVDKDLLLQAFNRLSDGGEYLNLRKSILVTGTKPSKATLSQST
jgi:hypothetical protein